MNEQLGYNELIKYVFENKSIDELLESGYLENVSYITKKGYEKINKFLKENKNLNNFNLILGILSSLAYGYSQEIEKEITEALITNNKKLIFSNIDRLEEITQGTLKLEKSIWLNEIINMKMSFNLLRNLDYNWIHFDLYKKHFYGIDYLLIYLSKYYFSDFESWFLSTKSNNLKIIFTSKILSNDNLYEMNETFLNSKIDFLRAKSKIAFFTWKEKIFNNQKQITDLPIDEESICFVMFYINKKYYKLNKENIPSFEQDIRKIKKYFVFLSEKKLNEFIKYINFEILYRIIKEVDNNSIKECLLNELFREIKQQFELFFSKSSFDENEVEKINLYGKIILDLQNKEEIENIKNNFEKICREINEPYYFYRFNNKWRLFLKRLIYYLIIIYIAYFSDYTNHYLIIDYKNKILKTIKEYDFYDRNTLELLLNQIQLLENNK